MSVHCDHRCSPALSSPPIAPVQTLLPGGTPANANTVEIPGFTTHRK